MAKEKDFTLLDKEDYEQFMEASSIAIKEFAAEMKREIKDDEDPSKRKSAVEAKTKAAESYYGMFVLQGKMREEMALRVPQKGGESTFKPADKKPGKKRPIEERSIGSLDH